jgi:hypothetical protein
VTPEQEREVARALAETARHEPSTPIPDDVARRLDDVLAELRGQPVTAAREPHDEVAVARRRRRRPRLLAAAVAAAVVAVIGAAVVPRLGGTTGSDTAASSAGRQDKGAGGARAEGGPFAADGTTVPQLSTATLARDVQRVVDAGPPDRRRDLAAPATGKEPSAARSCLIPPVGPGERLVAVRLDGRPASLVLGAAHEGVRSARVYSCLGPVTPVARTEVRSR